MANATASDYALGYSDAEQDRLIRQATLLAPITERLFREAGIRSGSRVLDIGSGMGDVAMIAARLVGTSGEIVGIERNAGFIARARKRVATIGFRNVIFIQADANALAIDGTFDAVVGRLVLNHNPDPVAMLRSVTQLLIPGGILAFQEVAVSPALAVADGLPLWSQVVTRIQEMIRESGMQPDAGLALHRIFQEAGFPGPHAHLDLPFTQDGSIAQLEVDLLRSLAGQDGVSLADLGDLETLAKRIHTEAVSARSAIGFVAIVSAWARRIA
jgi:protein-L-isoaspartate O-methyltransferase